MSQYDCISCEKRQQKNRTPGRLCLLERDLQERPLKLRNKVIITSMDQLDSLLDELEEKFPIELALQKLGICPKSFPLSRFTFRALELFDLCHGGPTGTDLLHLPVCPTILDNPNIFFEAREVIIKEKNEYQQEKEKELKSKGKNV